MPKAHKIVQRKWNTRHKIKKLFFHYATVRYLSFLTQVRKGWIPDSHDKYDFLFFFLVQNNSNMLEKFTGYLLAGHPVCTTSECSISLHRVLTSEWKWKRGRSNWLSCRESVWGTIPESHGLNDLYLEITIRGAIRLSNLPRLIDDKRWVIW